MYSQDDKERKEGDGEEKDGGEEEKEKKEDEAAAAAAAETGSSSGAAGAAQGGDKKDVLSVHSTFMDVVVRLGQIGERHLRAPSPSENAGHLGEGRGGAVFGLGLVTFFILEAAEKTPPLPLLEGLVRSSALRLYPPLEFSKGAGGGGRGGGENQKVGNEGWETRKEGTLKSFHPSLLPPPNACPQDCLEWETE